MGLTSDFLLYAGLYRLAVIGAGIIAILLGYRLFIKGAGVGGNANAEAGASMTAKSDAFEFSIKNAAPGTCFSLFGAALIVAMVVQAGPELALQSGDTATGQSVRIKGSGRGGGFERHWVTAENKQRSGDMGAAIDAYGAALAADDVTVDGVARVADAIAAVYLSQGRSAEALAMARLSVQIRPDKASFLLTLSRVAGANGKAAEAMAAKRRAAAGGK